ncbi:MAG: DUF4336 domain-containing protein [Pseudomonadota bacterium]
MTTTGYEPLNTLKPVAKGLWLIDGAPITRAFVPIPMRAIVVQLQNGGLWIYAPTDLTTGVATELAELGPVAHLVAPTPDYEMQVGAWSAAYPEAQVWTIGNLKADKAEAPWKGQLHQLVVRSGAKRREAVFCHRPSRTLFFADLFEVLETKHLAPWVRPIVWFSGTDDSGGHMRPSHRWGRKYDEKVALGRDIETMIGWGARGLIPGHGRLFEAHASRQLERAFRKELRPLRWETAFQKKSGT